MNKLQDVRTFMENEVRQSEIESVDPSQPRDMRKKYSEARDKEGHSLLHWACLFTDLELIDFLAGEIGIDVNATAKDSKQT